MRGLNIVWNIFWVIALVGCTQNGSALAENDNSELERIYLSDQTERKGEIDWEVVSENDKQRRNRVQQLLDSNEVKTSQDFYHAAMIFQHGNDTTSSALAVKLMTKAIELDSTRDKWLLAAAIDRDLMRRNLPQIYGTQFIKLNPESPWQLYQLDSTKITDEERMEFGVETISKLKDKLEAMNGKSNR